MPRGRWGKGGADAFAGNQECFDTVQGSDELLQWCIVNPADPRTFEQADAMLRSDNCVGLKFHPEEHCYTLAEHGEELFKFAAARSATVLVHSGDRHSAPMDFLPFADAHPEIKLVLAHLGNSGDMKAGKGGGDPTHQLRAIGASRNHNIYVDTSSAASITPGLIECAFPCLLRACTPWHAQRSYELTLQVRRYRYAVSEVGSDRIVFGTDTPLYFSPMQRARIDYADISDADRANILRNTAADILNLELAKSSL
jgi:predicted TIM-barrel fold metal-dependent hydrolase